jgi:uncharacterized protein (TIGR02444 family)
LQQQTATKQQEFPLPSPTDIESLWEFSLRVYASGAVSEACLNLQDRYALDVNLLLFCCWHGCYYGQISTSMLNEALAVSRQWADNVVIPLRKTRSWMKGRQALLGGEPAVFNALRDGVKKLELRAEQMQQYKLQALLESSQATHAGDGDSSVIHHNLCLYLQTKGIVQDSFLKNRLDILLANASLPAKPGSDT